MPHARYVWFAIALLGSRPAAAQAMIAPGLLCSRPEVLDVVAVDIARGGMPRVIVPGEIGEAPTGRPDTVRCAVRISTQFYDTNQFGFAPQYRLSILEFTVRSGRNGLFVDALGTPR